MVRSETLPISTAFLGTSRITVHMNSSAPNTSAAVRTVRSNRSPRPQQIQIAPNKYATQGFAGSQGSTSRTSYCEPSEWPTCRAITQVSTPKATIAKEKTYRPIIAIIAIISVAPDCAIIRQ